MSLKALIFALFFINSVTLAIIYYYVQHLASTDVLSQKSSEHGNSISFIVTDFEIFKHNIPATVRTICEKFSSEIFIASDQAVYPPIDLTGVPKECTVSLIESTPSPEKLFDDNRVENLVKSDYVVLLRDGYTILSNSSIKHNIRNNVISVLAVENNCKKLTYDILRWTLKFVSSEENEGCNYFDKTAGFVLSSKLWKSLNQPLMRPLDISIFFQAYLRNITVERNRSIKVARFETTFDPEDEYRLEQYHEYRLKNLFAKFSIKLVKNADDSNTFYGCSKRSARCFDTIVNDLPEYLYAERWTPPCCLQRLRETAAHVFKVLDAYKIRYWLEGGSLLGAVRNQDIIPWDYDVDIGVYHEDLKKLVIFESCETQPVKDEHGFVWEKAIDGDYFHVQYSETNRLHVDIFPFRAVNGTMTKDTWFSSHSQDVEFPESALKPLIRISFAGSQPLAPHDPVSFLEFKFGKGVVDKPSYPSKLGMQFPPKIIID